MTSPLLSGIVKQRNWSNEELTAAGFAKYERKKQLVMARALPANEAPLTIVWPLETLVVDTGYIICYDPAQGIRPALSDYDYWPVRPDIFERSYQVWDEPDWIPSLAEDHLMRLGCKPYFKSQGLWARRLTASIHVQSLESQEVVLVPVGNWLAIGPLGEPWYIDDINFQNRYRPIGP